MTIRSILAEVARLDDTRLETLVRDGIDEASRRPAMRPGLIQLLAGVLEEIKAERLCRLELSPEEIARLSHVPLSFASASLAASPGAERAPEGPAS